MHSSSPSTLRYTIIGCGALALWATSLPFARQCVESLGPFTTVMIPYLVSGILGMALNFIRGELRDLPFLKHWEFYARTALFTLYYIALYVAINIVARPQFPLVTLLNYLWPTIMMPLSVIILHQKCRMNLLLTGMLIVAAGITVEVLGAGSLAETFRGGTQNIIAYVSALAGAVLWSFYTAYNRKWGKRAGELRALPFILLATAAAMAVLRTIAKEHSSFTGDLVLPLAYLSIMPFLANICWDLGTRQGNIILLTLLADMMPWGSLTVARLYLSIPIGAETWISAVIIVAGALIARYSFISVAKVPLPSAPEP